MNGIRFRLTSPTLVKEEEKRRSKVVFNEENTVLQCNRENLSRQRSGERRLVGQ